MTPIRFASLIRLNEGDTALVNLDAIDAMLPCDHGDAGTILHLRGGEVVKVRERIDALMARLVDACVDPSATV